MQVHYLSGNPKKKTAKKITKKKNPHIETFSKGNEKKTVKRYELGEIQQLDRAVGKVGATKRKIDALSAKGKGKAGKVASKKLKGLSKGADRFMYGLQIEREEAKRGGRQAHELTAKGFKKSGSKFQPLNKMSSNENVEKFTKKLEKSARELSTGKFAKKLGKKISTQKRSHKAKLASERRVKNIAEKNALITSLQTKLARQKQKEKELKHLMTHGANENDKQELKALKEELKNTLSQLKGVSMSKKGKKKAVKKVAKKATKKVAKKATKKSAKRTTKKVAKKASKKVAKKASKRTRKNSRSKKAKVEAVVVKKPRKASKKGGKKGGKKGKNKSKKANPYVVASNPKRRKHKRRAKKSNPIMKFASNPTMALGNVANNLAESLGLKGEALIEVGTVAGVSAIQPLVMNMLRSKVGFVETFMAKIESLLPAQMAETTPNLVVALASSVGSMLASKKAPKVAKALDHIARANLMIATVKIAESLGETVAEKAGMAGYVTAPNPRSMGAYVLDRPMGSLPRASTDFQGADFEGVDFGTNTIAGEDDEDERPDFGSDVISVQGLSGEW